MKKGYKIAALLICVLFIISFAFAGCQPTAATTTAAKTTAATTTAATTAGPPEPVSFTCFINIDWFPNSEWKGIITDAITEVTGVSLVPTICVDYAQLGLLIASGDLPELVVTPNGSNTGELSTSDLCFSYNELIEQYCPEWEPEPMAIANAKSFSQDDNYYTILNSFIGDMSVWKTVNAVPSTMSLVYRLDMLEDLGMSFKTIPELEAVYDAVLEKMPGVLPLSFNEYHTLRCFSIWMGAGDTNFVDEGDKVVFKTNGKNYKTYLQWCNKAYQKGWIHEDNFAGGDAMPPGIMRFSQGLCTQNLTYPENMALQKEDPKAHLVESIPLSDEPYIFANLGWYGTFITKTCKNPDRAINYIKWLFTPEGDKLAQWGREGVEYTLNETGGPVFSEEWMTAVADEYEFYRIYAPWFYFGCSPITQALGRVASIPADEYKNFYEEPYSAISANCFNYPWLKACEPKVGTDEQAIFGKLKDAVNTMWVECSLAKTDAEFEKVYTQWMDTMKTIGIQKLEDYVNSVMPDLKAAYQ